MTYVRRPVPAHRAPGGVIPLAELFEPLIERDPATAGHWWWSGDFHKFDCDNFAVMRAPIEPGSRRHGLWIVVRALWVHAHDAIDGHVKLVNTCGCVTCVNPTHVERERRDVNMSLPLDVRMSDGVRVELVRVGGRVHIVPVDVEHAVCGWRIRERRPVGEGVAITCVECLSMWRARGYPLREVST